MITFSDFPTLFVLGMGGATSLELLKLYEYRGKLTQKKYQAMLHSTTFWCVVLGMLCASGFIAWAFHAGSTDVSSWNVVVTGMAARSIVREIASAQVANSKTPLGEKPALRDIFA